MKGLFLLLTIICTAFATPKCPSGNSEAGNIHLSAEDCQHFYKCDHGKPYLMSCPPNQEWSQELQRCDWPEVAKCTPSSSNGTSPVPTSSEGTPTPAPTPKPTPPAHVSCPPNNPEGEDVLLPAGDCQHFYKCDHGKASLQDCPKDLEWSQELQRCDWPEVAKCTPSSSNGTTFAPTSSKGTPTPTPTSSSKPTHVSCPPNNPEGEDVLLPAEDCQHFYKCDHGKPYLIPCPPSQEWSQELQRCDWPEVAKCTPSSSNGTSPVPTSSEGTPTPAPTPKPTPPAHVSCPPNNPEGEDVLLPAGDCQHFYKCDHGEASLQDCPKDLEWSQELQRCDWPEVAKCTPSSSNGTSPVPTSSEGTPTPAPTPKPTPPAHVSCPPNNGEYETLLAIPGVCDKFYKCDFGVAKIENCPYGTQFSHTMLRCDFPDFANCVEGVTGIKF